MIDLVYYSVILRESVAFTKRKKIMQNDQMFCFIAVIIFMSHGSVFMSILMV